MGRKLTDLINLRIHGQGLKEVSEIIRETDNKLP